MLADTVDRRGFLQYSIVQIFDGGMFWCIWWPVKFVKMLGQPCICTRRIKDICKDLLIKSHNLINSYKIFLSIFCYTILIGVSNCEILGYHNSRIVIYHNCENYYDCHTMQTFSTNKQLEILSITFTICYRHQLLYYSDGSWCYGWLQHLIQE